MLFRKKKKKVFRSTKFTRIMIESCPVKNYNSIKNTIIFERRERVFQRNFNDIGELRVVYLPIKFYRLNITYCNRFNITYRNRGVRLHDVKMSSRASFLFTLRH